MVASSLEVAESLAKRLIVVEGTMFACALSELEAESPARSASSTRAAAASVPLDESAALPMELAIEELESPLVAESAACSAIGVIVAVGVGVSVVVAVGAGEGVGEGVGVPVVVAVAVAVEIDMDAWSLEAARSAASSWATI